MVLGGGWTFGEGEKEEREREEGTKKLTIETLRVRQQAQQTPKCSSSKTGSTDSFKGSILVDFDDGYS